MNTDSPLEFRIEIEDFKVTLSKKFCLQNVDPGTLRLQFKFGNFGFDASQEWMGEQVGWRMYAYLQVGVGGMFSL